LYTASFKLIVKQKNGFPAYKFYIKILKRIWCGIELDMVVFREKKYAKYLLCGKEQLNKLTNATYFHFENSQQQRMSPCLTKEKIPKY
jgi:hypothetical protein